MSSKKKFTIAIIAVAFVALAAVIALVSVLAAFTANVNNSITVSYTAVNVNATVECAYGSSEAGATTVVKSGEANLITFSTDDTDEEVTKNFNGIEATFSRSNKEIYVKYVIENTDDTNAFNVTINNTLADSNSNTLITYKVDSGEYATLAANTTDLGSLAAGATKTVIVKLALDNATKNVDLSGGIGFVLAA